MYHVRHMEGQFFFPSKVIIDPQKIEIFDQEIILVPFSVLVCWVSVLLPRESLVLNVGGYLRKDCSGLSSPHGLWVQRGLRFELWWNALVSWSQPWRSRLILSLPNFEVLMFLFNFVYIDLYSRLVYTISHTCRLLMTLLGFPVHVRAEY